MGIGTKLLGIGLATVFLASVSLAAGPEPTESDDDPSSPFVAGMAAADEADWDLAVRLFTEAVRLDPESADALNMLAYSQRQLGELEIAIENYERALAQDPDHEDAREYLGEALLLAGDLEGAKRQLAELERICPQGCEALEELREVIAEQKAGSQ